MSNGYVGSHRWCQRKSLSLSRSASERGDPDASSLVDTSLYFSPRKFLYGLTFYQVSGEQPKMILFLSSELVAIGLV